MREGTDSGDGGDTRESDRPREARAIAERAVPDRIASEALGETVTAIHAPRTGAVADTYVLELSGDPGRAVCKIGGRSVWTGEVVEPLVVDRVGARTELPVPDVYATGTVNRGGEIRRWAVYEHLDGAVPRDLEPRERRSVVRSAGAALGVLHDAFAFDRIGGLGRDGDALSLRRPSARNLLASAPVRDVRAAVAADDEERRPVLDHGDFFPGNLLVTDGELSAVLDWGNAHVTHAGYGLARAEARFVDLASAPRSERDRLRRAFRAGYAEHAPLPPAYRRRASIYKALWLAQSGANLLHVAGSERGRRQLRRQLRNWTSRRARSIVGRP